MIFECHLTSMKMTAFMISSYLHATTDR